MPRASSSTVERWSARLDAIAARLTIERERLYETTGILASLAVLIKIIFGELWLGIAALPLYVFVPSRRVVKDPERFPEKVFAYRLRRAFTLGVILLIVVRAGGTWAWKEWGILTRPVSRNDITYTWSFANPSALLSFAYDPKTIQIRGGVAVVPGGQARTHDDSKDIERCAAIIEAREPFRLKASDTLIDFSAIASAGSGTVTFQVSNDGGAAWWYAEEGLWKKASTGARDDVFSSLQQIKRALTNFPRSQDREDILLFKARLETDCVASAELSSVSVTVRALPKEESSPMLGSEAADQSVPIGTIGSMSAALFAFKTSEFIPSPYSLALNADPSNRSIVVSGHALAHAQVVVFADTPPTALYRTVADENGRWSVRHEQAYAPLSPGRHVFYAVSRDPVSPFVSAPSEGIAFDMIENETPTILTLFDTKSTLITFFALSLITLLVSYNMPKKKV